MAAAALLGATAVGLAGPAGAEELTSGMYGVAQRSGVAAGKYADDVDREALRIRLRADIRQPGTTWNMRLENGQWTASQHKATAVDCKNGYSAPGTSVFSLNPQTLRGTIVSTSDGPACGSPAPITSGPVIVFMDKA